MELHRFLVDTTEFKERKKRAVELFEFLFVCFRLLFNVRVVFVFRGILSFNSLNRKETIFHFANHERQTIKMMQIWAHAHQIIANFIN